MKHLLTSILVIFIVVPTIANDGKELLNASSYSLLYDNYLDPGHKQKRGSQLGKDRSAIELYLGSQPSFALKLNFYGSKHGTLTERVYLMTGMDFDTDLHAKMGILLNPGKYNKNRSLSNPQMGWWKLWRYVMVRKAIEIGYKTQFLDPEETTEEKLSSTNYGGLTVNYSWMFDGNFIFDRTAWYFLDHRTARRIRLKVDVGFFFNFDQFNQAHLGAFSSANNSNGTEFNEDVPNDLVPEDNEAYGDPLQMATYPVLSPFLNLSVGFAF
jgi:hypothetical protein